MNLLWEFYRQVTTADGLGACVHYYDESAQSLFLNAGHIKTRTGVVDAGHWSAGELGSVQDIGSYGYTLLAFDHPHNGTLYGLATDGTSLYFLRHVYAMDISDMYESGQWQEQIDNQIKQLSLSVKNISPETFVAENTLFNPGAKVSVQFTSGDSAPYSIGIAYVDDVDYDAYAATIPVAGRNSIGYFLAEQTFDDRNIYTGGRSTVYTLILLDAGITVYHVQPDDTPMSLQFDFDKRIIDGINETLKTIGWRMIELSNGEVVIGDETYIGSYNTNGRYTFNGGSEAFKRATSKNADAAYTRVCVKSSDGIAVYRDVPNWERWKIGRRKTKYYDAPEGYGMADMESMADGLVDELQYVGIGEAFSSPIRPQLQVGDIAEVYYQGDTESTSLGIITQVAHQFGSSGFRTDFNLDSGGIATSSGEYAIVSKAAMLNGYNRKQRVIDFMGMLAEKKAISVYSGGGLIVVQNTMTEAVSIAAASILKIL